MDYKLFLFVLIILPFTNFAQEEYIYRSGDDLIISDHTRSDGISYKVEVIRLKEINPNDPELNRLKKLGPVHTEFIENKDLKALLLGGFELEKAKAVHRKIIEMGFIDAKLVKYENGLRVTQVKS